MKYRRKPWSADANHFHHRMARIGFSQRKTVAYLYAWTLLMATLAVSLRLILHHHHQPGWLAVVIGLAVVCAIASLYLIYVLEILKSRASGRSSCAAAIPAPLSTRSTRRSPRDLETGEFERVR